MVNDRGSLLNPGSTVVSFLSGAAAGVADTAINYPPYCLHYRLQRGESLWRRFVYRPRELYRGVLAYSAIIPITCISDGLTDKLKASGVSPFVASFTSGMVAALVISAPVGNSIVTNLRLKAGHKPAGSIIAMYHIYHHYGLRGFYVGIQPLLVREGIYASSVFYGKRAIQDRLGCHDLTAASISGTIATLFSQPMDTLATHMQNQTHRTSMVDNIQQMWTSGGLVRFYRGFYLRWIAIISGVYVMDRTSTSVKDKLNRKFSST